MEIHKAHSVCSYSIKGYCKMSVIVVDKCFVLLMSQLYIQKLQEYLVTFVVKPCTQESVFTWWVVIFTYRRIPVISPGLIQVCKGFWVCL